MFQWELKNDTDCLKMKHFIDIKSEATLFKIPKKQPDDPLFVFNMMYKSTEKTVHKERLVYDKSGMVSQVGGVLSLFLGFSFFSLISDFLEFIAKKKMANLTCRKPPSSAIGEDTQISMEN